MLEIIINTTVHIVHFIPKQKKMKRLGHGDNKREAMWHPVTQ